MATPSTAPLVYISCSRWDQEWLERLLKWLVPLQKSGQIRTFTTRDLTPGVKLIDAIQENLDQASLGIVLLSPSWLADTAPPSTEYSRLSSRPVLPILVRPCEWQGHAIGLRQLLTTDGKSLVEVSESAQEKVFAEAVRWIEGQIGRHATPGFSAEALQIYSLAQQLVRSRASSTPVDAECVLFACLERGRQNPGVAKAPQYLWGAIPAERRSRFEEQFRLRFPRFSSSTPSINPEASSPVLERAASLSRSSRGGGRVSAIHLLGAALAEPGADEVLRDFGVDCEELKRDFLKMIFRRLPKEPKDVWSAFLLSSHEPEPPPKPQAPAKPLVPAYQCEDWDGEDLLDTKRDVNALAALVAGWNVQPPLSIGLFGEWGSGKSFFMRQMRKRVKTLALAAQSSGKPQRECAYYKNIAQIEFNAWHYMEGDNLWACLVEHIFSHLGLPQDTTAEQVARRQKQILEKIGVEQQLQARAKATQGELEKKRDQAAQRVDDARTQRDAAAAALEKEKTALRSRLSRQLSSEVDKTLRLIPSITWLRDEVDTVRSLTRDVASTAGRLKVLGTMLWNNRQRWPVLSLAVGGPAAIAGVAALLRKAAPGYPLVDSLVTQALLSLAPLIAAIHRLLPVAAKIREVVATLEQKNQEITQAIAQAEREQKETLACLEGDVEVLTDAIRQASREQQKHQQAIEDLNRELASTDANRLLAEFIRSRADADDYRKHLGMVALVRRDFESLSDYFRTQRADEMRGAERVDDNTVNRIVLYIDDLDRCPPETVVHMLQAIHLLLAFPIFVVVVAVDSRWVSRSLEECYEWLAADGAGGATAHDYLEKIFQIPFWLEPMTSTACQSLLHGLTAAVTRDQQTLRQSIEASRPKPAAAPAAALNGEQPAEVEPPSAPAEAPAAAVTQPPPETIDLAPRQLDVEKAELDKLDELAALIGRSPRVAKRFLNCYRLMKARMDETELDEFLKAPFAHVMDVLAIMVGAPAISHTVLAALATDSAGCDGKRFVEKLAKILPASALEAGEGAQILRLMAAADVERVKALCAAVPVVLRFSFAAHSGGRAPKPSATEGKANATTA